MYDAGDPKRRSHVKPGEPQWLLVPKIYKLPFFVFWSPKCFSSLHEPGWSPAEVPSRIS